jgi:hypothetical protein
LYALVAAVTLAAALLYRLAAAAFAWGGVMMRRGRQKDQAAVSVAALPVPDKAPQSITEYREYFKMRSAAPEKE